MNTSSTITGESILDFTRKNYSMEEYRMVEYMLLNYPDDIECGLSRKFLYEMVCARIYYEMCNYIIGEYARYKDDEYR